MIYPTYVAKFLRISRVDHIHANFAREIFCPHNMLLYMMSYKDGGLYEILYSLACQPLHPQKVGLTSLVYRFMLGSDFRGQPVAPIRLQNTCKL